MPFFGFWLILLGKVMRNQYKWCELSPECGEGSCLHRIPLLTCVKVLCQLISVPKHLSERSRGTHNIDPSYSWVNSLRWARQSDLGLELKFSLVSMCYCPKESLVHCRHLDIERMYEWKCYTSAFFQSVLYGALVLWRSLWKSSWTNKLGNVSLWECHWVFVLQKRKHVTFV